jgi:hypothetical protein
VTPNDVLAELRAVAPETLSPGALRGLLLEAHPDATRDQVLQQLKQLERLGLAKEVRHWEWAVT